MNHLATNSPQCNGHQCWTEVLQMVGPNLQ